MKKNLFSTLLFSTIVLSLTLSFCKKGDAGEKGDAGVAGATIVSGSGIPSILLGKPGDYFVDTTGKVLWGPKNTLSWGAGIAMVGPTGMPGKSLLSGTGAPAGALGTTGDFYIDITANTIYGPKAFGWGLPTSLVGATGPAGAPGATGAAGTPAQVIYSPWITSPYNSRDTTVDGTCVRIRHLNAPSLSTLILDRGVMITYFRVGSIGPYQLPYVSDAGGATNQVNCMYNQNKIFVYRHTYNTCRFNSGIAESYPGQPVLVNLPQSLEYRYVFIPGLIAGGRMANGLSNGGNLHSVMIPGSNTPVDLTTKTYAEVCNMLGIVQ